ncbi:MAG: virulence RhuM family protein [Phycisphaeraceae bacterium]|nr:virulence RhuM family protein [Phycisphaeraceae bacterium]
MADIIPQDPGGEFLLYQAQDGQTHIQCRFEGETLWLTQQQMAELFDVDKSGISRHLKNIYDSGELKMTSTVAKFATVQNEGNRQVERVIEHFNLDAIISVGYRVNSLRGTQFRIWATQRLREYLVKGFAMDDQRLKDAGGGLYFDELLARIRDIRSSEKVFWRKVLDIYATSMDYDPKAELSQTFFKVVQNKLHWASHGHTAAEIIVERADAHESHMGMTNWPRENIRKSDITVAKNYLKPDELEMLNRMVTAYLELAELQPLNRQPMSMKDWVTRLDDFLKMTGRELLTHAGSVSHQDALDKAQAEYEKYRQRILNEPTPVEKHFLKAVKEIKKLEDQKKSNDEKGNK